MFAFWSPNSAINTTQRECMMYLIFLLIMIYITVKEVLDPSKEAYIAAFLCGFRQAFEQDHSDHFFVSARVKVIP